ncbi:MAG TPA: sulfatase [Planctomycetota bacterium]
MAGRRTVAALALLLAACSRGPRPTTSVLLVSLDSVRADFLGCYGAALPHAPGRTPSAHLDRLAAEGVLYENARSTTSWTLPAHATLFTGLPELVHGVEQDGQRLPEELATLAERLRAAGYRTYGVYSGPYLAPSYGFGRGFERYEAAYGPALAGALAELEVAARLVESLDVAREPARARVAVERRAAAVGAVEAASHADVSSERVTAQALAELARAAADGRPFLLFAHYFDPHYDYAPPAAVGRSFDPEYRGRLDARGYVTNPAIVTYDPSSPTGRRRVVSERDLEHVQALYAGEIAWTDRHVGRLLEELARLGLSESTLVVVVGDHGDEFFEHGSIGHRQTLHEEVLRVPAILRLPGVLPAGARRAEPVTLADLGREILRLVLPSADLGPALPTVGRLVRVDLEPLSFELDGAPRAVEGSRVRILESFWSGSLKLLRVRERLEPGQPLAADESAAFARAAAERFAREELRWIDLAAHPGEPEEAWSTDFSDPRARAALAEFRAAHAELGARRAAPPLVAETEELVAALRGLGYVGQEAPQGTLAATDLLLPPPGEGLDPGN